MNGQRSLDVKAVLILQKATKAYGAGRSVRVVLRDMDLEIAGTGCTAIMGPNGCGKSTVIRALCGLERLTGGDVRQPESADLSATVLQHFRSQLIGELSGNRNILLPFGGHHAPTPSQRAALRYVHWLLDRLGFAIDLTKRVGSLSGGEQQALVFVRSLLFRPALWLLDEPASAIDFTRRRRLLDTLWMRSERCATLMATHDVNDAILVARRLLVFDSTMATVLDKVLPAPDGSRLASRLQSSWATELRDELTFITHAGR